MKHDVDIAKLARLYADGSTIREIGALIGVPHRTVGRYLKKAGVEMRVPGPERVEKLRNKKWLQSEYDNGKSTTQIADHLNCTASRVSYWLRRHGIDTRGTGSERGHNRCTPTARRKMSIAKRGKNLGPDNHRWKGGIKSADPERNRYRSKQWVRAVKERDNFTCRWCGCQEHLHAHHIKRWKHYPELRYELSNGLTLCKDCHSEAHGRPLYVAPNKQNAPRVHRPSQ